MEKNSLHGAVLYDNILDTVTWLGLLSNNREMSNLNDVEKLLSDVVAIRQKHEAIWQRTGERFNIFSIFNVERKEIRICRFIHELLSPNGKHDQSDLYLKLFFDDVLKDIEMKDDDWASLNVHREKVTDDERRIDIVITTKSKYIGIEVKIDADDQPRQVYDYYKEAESHGQPWIYYLTKDGKKPSNKSAVTLEEDVIGNKGYRCISFSKHIVKWLEDCLLQHQTMRSATIREGLCQFIAMVKKLPNNVSESEKMLRDDIYENITKDISTMKAAYDIQSVFKANFFVAPGKKIFPLIEKQLAEKYSSMFRDTSKYAMYYFYDKLNMDGNIEVWVKAGIDEYKGITFGYCLAKDGKSIDVKELNSENNDANLKERIVTALKEKGIEPDDDFTRYDDYVWINCKELDPPIKPFGKDPDYTDTYFELYCDDVKLGALINRCVSKIEELLLNEPNI